MNKYKTISVGLISGILFLGLYFGILTIGNSFEHALDQFKAMWYWIIILTIGFSIQVSLYFFIRSLVKEGLSSATAEMTVSSSVSTGSMIACCAHHVVDVLPIIGVSAAATFLTQYQVSFILVGIFSNLIGILMMLNILKKHDDVLNSKLTKKILQFDLLKLRNSTIIVAIIVVSVSFLVK